MKKSVTILAGLLVVAGAALLLYFTSSLSHTTATATFSKDEEIAGLNQLQVKAPYGYYVIRYSVVPRSLGAELQQNPFTVGGIGVGNDPAGLFNVDKTSSNYFPGSGTIEEIPVETHFLISSNLNLAATAEMPKDQRILSRCGTYLFVTKDRSIFQKIVSIVESWTIDAEQDGTSNGG